MKAPKKSTANFIIDIIALIQFILLLSTGLLIRYVLPRRSHGASVWGLTRHEWAEIHFLIAIVFLIAVTIHVYLHWHWILSMIKGRTPAYFTLRIVIGVIILIALIVLAIAPFCSTTGV